jgi:hypothetical protein
MIRVSLGLHRCYLGTNSGVLECSGHHVQLYMYRGYMATILMYIAAMLISLDGIWELYYDKMEPYWSTVGASWGFVWLLGRSMRG